MDLSWGYGALGSLPRIRECRARRASSYDRSGVAYWYQIEPHAPFPPMPAVADRLPRR